MSFVFLLANTRTLSMQTVRFRYNGQQKGKVSHSYRSQFYSSTSGYELPTDLFLEVNCLYLGTTIQLFLQNSGFTRQNLTMIIRLRLFLNKWYIANLRENSANYILYEILKKHHGLVWVVHDDH